MEEKIQSKGQEWEHQEGQDLTQGRLRRKEEGKTHRQALSEWNEKDR